MKKLLSLLGPMNPNVLHSRVREKEADIPARKVGEKDQAGGINCHALRRAPRRTVSPEVQTYRGTAYPKQPRRDTACPHDLEMWRIFRLQQRPPDDGDRGKPGIECTLRERGIQ